MSKYHIFVLPRHCLQARTYRMGLGPGGGKHRRVFLASKAKFQLDGRSDRQQFRQMIGCRKPRIKAKYPNRQEERENIKALTGNSQTSWKEGNSASDAHA